MEKTMKLQDIKIKEKFVQGIEIPLKNATLILIVAPKGYIVCGYWNMQSAEKFGDAACIVRGVKNIDDALKAKIEDVSKAAKKIGIKKGLSAIKALEKML